MRASSDDDGQVVVLILGFAVMLALLVTVVIDVSTLFLQRRSLASIADSAALSAAQQIDEATFYTGTGDQFVPLDRERARRRAEDHVAHVESGALSGLRVTRVVVTDDTVAVTTTARVRLPFVNAVTGHRDGVQVTVQSAARSPIS